MILNYNKKLWREAPVEPKRTVQMFITNRCNLRCKDCFYGPYLSSQDMSLEEYSKLILPISACHTKINILGGEPALHADLFEMLRRNARWGFETVVYTNGQVGLEALCQRASEINRAYDNPRLIRIRVGVHGFTESEKPLTKLVDNAERFTLVYMMSPETWFDVPVVPKYLAEHFPKVEDLCISSISDCSSKEALIFGGTRAFGLSEYALVVESVINNVNYWGNIKRLHIPCRGVLKPSGIPLQHCRFSNIFPAGSTPVTCPFDIMAKRQKDGIRCNKAIYQGCLLQKIVLERIV